MHLFKLCQIVIGLLLGSAASAQLPATTFDSSGFEIEQIDPMLLIPGEAAVTRVLKTIFIFYGDPFPVGSCSR